MKKAFISTITLSLLLVLLFVTGCSDDNVVGLARDLQGSWGTTAIEGPPPEYEINASVSTFTFNENGTYAWFLDAPPWYDRTDYGNYTLSGDTLFLNGGVLEYSGFTHQPGSYLILDRSGDFFSFRDADNDKWTYQWLSE